MVTKQEQLEWLAKKYKTWPEQGSSTLRLSALEVGKFAVINAYIITRKEWRQEREKMSDKPEVDNLWHERGEFPPAGTVCEVHENEWVETFIIGMDKEGYCVYTTGDQYVGYDGENDPSNFRPLCTEREKSIDAACEVIGDVIGGRLIIERLYDAGILK